MNTKNRIILYTDTLCPICSVVEKFLSDQGVEYSKVNIDKDSEGKKAFLKLGYDNLPVLDVEGTTILGFNPEAIENALKEKHVLRK
jgi:glutaredoxin